MHKEILIADDDAGYRALVDKEIRRAGYQTLGVPNGEEAFVALWEKPHVDLVLIDVRLLLINGLNIFGIIRKDFPDKKIIISGVKKKEDQPFLIYSADDYYDKSQNVSVLINKIDKVLNNNTPENSRRSEKRSCKRVPVNVLANFERGKHGVFSICSRFTSYAKDLSMWGGRFVVSEDIKVGQYLTMALELPVNFLPLLIACEVVWVKRLEEFSSKTRGCVEAGVKFVKLYSPRDEEKLKNYLNCA